MTDSEIMSKLADNGLGHVYRIRSFTATLARRKLRIEMRCTEDPRVMPAFRCGVVVSEEDGGTLEVEYGETEAAALARVRWGLVRAMIVGKQVHIGDTAADMPTLLMLDEERDEP